MKAFSRSEVGVAAGRPIPEVNAQHGFVASRSSLFSAILLDEIKVRLESHDFLAVGRLMAIRRDAWNVQNTNQPHCDRVVANTASLAGWKIAWMPDARVYYLPPKAYSGLRSDWQRTRLGLHATLLTFDPIPTSTKIGAMWVSAFRFPSGAFLWAMVRIFLTVEAQFKRKTMTGQHVHWA